jgi:predicted Zn finger-like uncharacterized protein
MILTCPACATQYRLKDGAIPPEGRQVRCAACKHKWHQDGDAEGTAANRTAEEADQAIGIAPPQPDPRQSEPAVAEVPAAEAREEMFAGEPQPRAPTADREFEGDAPVVEAEPAAPITSPAAEEFVQPPVEEDYGFAAIPAMHDEDEPRRGGMLGWIVAIILLVVAAAAAFWFLAPAELKARAGIAEAGESELLFKVDSQDRQRLASGNELYAVSGRVINSTDRELAVPPIRAELRDPTTKRVVYQWTIAPPARSLAPNTSAPFNSAEVDVPKGGDLLSLSFAG